MKNFILFIIVLIALLFVLSLPSNAQSKRDKPLKVLVQQIEKIGDSIEVYVKWHNSKYRHGDLHFFKTFKTIPENLKVGCMIFLYPSNSKKEFTVVKK